MLKGEKKKKARHLHSNAKHKTFIWYIRDVTFKLSQKPRPNSWGCEDGLGTPMQDGGRYLRGRTVYV